jgi:tetratricopeptide (TPR) repeat protein
MKHRSGQSLLGWPAAVLAWTTLFFLDGSQPLLAESQASKKNTSAGSEVRKTVTDAIALMQNHKTEAALATLQLALAKYPESEVLHFQLGNAFADCRDYRNAIEEYQTALKIKPDLAEATLNMAYAYCNTGQNSEAVDCFQRFLKINPDSAKVPLVQTQMLTAAAADCLERQRAYDAKKLLEHAIQISPQDFHAHFKLGRALDELGDTQGAIGQYEEVLRIQPSHSAAVFNIAGCYQSMGMPDQAIIWFQRYLKRNPNAPDAVTVTNMINKLKDAEHQPMLDPRRPDFLESVTENGRCFRWPRERLPLRIYVQDGTGTAGFRPAYTKALYDSLSEWSRASQNRILFNLVQDPRQADIVCTWTADPYEVRQSNTEDVEQAACAIRFSNNPMQGFIPILHADLRILTVDRELRKPLSDDDMKKTCLHELGHALGLPSRYHRRCGRFCPSVTKRRC